MSDERELELLRHEQQRRKQEEERARDRATEPVERRTHARRAEKADYLSEKLEEQAHASDE